MKGGSLQSAAAAASRLVGRSSTSSAPARAAAATAANNGSSSSRRAPAACASCMGPADAPASRRSISSSSRALESRPPLTSPGSVSAQAQAQEALATLPQGVMVSSTQPTYVRIPTAEEQSAGAVMPVAPPGAFTVAPSRPPTHGVHVATLSLRAYGTNLPSLEFFCNFARHAAYALDIPAGQVARLPTRTRLWTVPKSPFVHKKRQENFWRRTHKRAIKVYDAHDDVVDAWLHFLRAWAMPAVGMKVQLFRYHDLGVGSSMLKQALEAQSAEARRRQQQRSIEAGASSSSAEGAQPEADSEAAASETLASAAAGVASTEAQVKALAEELLKKDEFKDDEPAQAAQVAQAEQPEQPQQPEPVEQPATQAAQATTQAEAAPTTTQAAAPEAAPAAEQPAEAPAAEAAAEDAPVTTADAAPKVEEAASSPEAAPAAPESAPNTPEGASASESTEKKE